MEKKRKVTRIKPYFCHDENLEFVQLKRECSTQARFISVVDVMKKQGATDPEVINACNKYDYHVITHNTSDFRHASSKIKIGIICIGLKVEDAWISKMSKLLRKLTKHDDLYHKTIFIENTIVITDRRTKEVTIL